MVVATVLVAIIPLVVMTAINYRESRRALRSEAIEPMRVLLHKARHSFELFLTERRSTVSFIANAYTFEELADQRTLSRVFQVMKREFGGFVDLGLINSDGVQVTYAGPYSLTGKNYSEQDWFHEVGVRGTHISDVFLGYRRYPHFVIAVQQLMPQGDRWIVRATIDTDTFDSLIASTHLDPSGDAFLVNRRGTLQTASRYYGAALDACSLELPAAGSEPTVTEVVDGEGRGILLGQVQLKSVPMTLVLVRPSVQVLRSWHTLRNQLLIIFVISVVVIFAVVLRLTDVVVRRLEASERRQRQAMHEVEHSNKLASIGMLAAGVAHEINNPTAIIDQKAGLMRDLLETATGNPLREKFMLLTDSILNSVDRVRTVTHRLLGFARRMDVKVEVIDVNDVLREVLGFLEQEAIHRNLQISLELAEDLPRIASDEGQLQQVFLNILSNSFAAVGDIGSVTLRSWTKDRESIAVAIADNGCGMSAETMRHIFEPFFTTKEKYGTGLGLSITYGIVKRLGGEIEVESAEGTGTTFTVILPRSGSSNDGGGDG